MRAATFQSDEAAAVLPAPCPRPSLSVSSHVSVLVFHHRRPPCSRLTTFSSISKGPNAKWIHGRGGVDHRDKGKKVTFSSATRLFLRSCHDFALSKCENVQCCCGSSKEQRPRAQFLISVPLLRFGPRFAISCPLLLCSSGHLGDDFFCFPFVSSITDH